MRSRAAAILFSVCAVMVAVSPASSAVPPDSGRSRMTFAADSSFRLSKPEALRESHPVWRVERDGVVTGNVKMSIMIVPANSMIDPGMIDLIPGRKTGTARMLLRGKKIIVVDPR